MPRPKNTPEIIIGKLREVEVLVAKGATVAEASRQIGVTEQTLYRWQGIRRHACRPGAAAEGPRS